MTYPFLFTYNQAKRSDVLKLLGVFSSTQLVSPSLCAIFFLCPLLVNCFETGFVPCKLFAQFCTCPRCYTLRCTFILNDWSRHFFCSPISFKNDYPWISLPLLCLSCMADSIPSLTVVMLTQLFLSHAHLARNSVLVVSRVESQFCVT